MMRNLLWWCIWLLAVGSQGLVAGGPWSVVGINTLRGRPPSRAPHTAQVQGGQPTGHRPPTTDHLPCQDASPTCLQMLGELTVKNSREITVLEQAITWQKKKLWTNWLNADGWHPLAMGLRIARNIAGGGDRAAAKLEIARLELRRAELIANLHQAVRQAMWDFEAARQKVQEWEQKQTIQMLQVQWAEINYRFGEGQTEALLSHWQNLAEGKMQLVWARQQQEKRRAELLRLLHIPNTH